MIIGDRDFLRATTDADGSSINARASVRDSDETKKVLYARENWKKKYRNFEILRIICNIIILTSMYTLLVCSIYLYSFE